jgi:hypothetical protein
MAKPSTRRERRLSYDFADAKSNRNAQNRGKCHWHFSGQTWKTHSSSTKTLQKMCSKIRRFAAKTELANELAEID